MSKAFTRETDGGDDDDDIALPPLPVGGKNYITPQGYARLREIDRRIRFLTKRLEVAEVTDPSVHHGGEQVFFGARVTYADDDGAERSVTIKGIDEVDNSQGEVSWISPIARTLLRARVGDVLQLPTPAGVKEIEVLAVAYPAPAGPA